MTLYVHKWKGNWLRFELKPEVLTFGSSNSYQLFDPLGFINNNRNKDKWNVPPLIQTYSVKQRNMHVVHRPSSDVSTIHLWTGRKKIQTPKKTRALLQLFSLQCDLKNSNEH